jgi:outer membrane receptor protein involved in Fe transport
LTTGTFDAPQQMLADNFSRSVAYLALSAPVGDHADWAARAALTQGDIASWIIAGEYTTRAPATHQYDLGLSYSAQRYPGSNVAALGGVGDVGHSAGAVYGFDTFTITPAVTLTYGARYSRYDYLNDRTLVSPRASVTVEPVEHLRVSAMVSHKALAPGAEEFLPRVDSPVWLPPQRTFSAFLPDERLQAERTDHVEVGIERDISATTLLFRAYRQHVADQLVTVFGSDATPQSQATQASQIGHYLIGNAGNVDASGLSAGVRANIAHHVHGSVEYSMTNARWNSIADDRYLLVLTSSAMRQMPQQIHDVSTSIETNVPETSTRVLVLYRVSNGFAHPLNGAPQQSVAGTSDRPGLLESRFDVQLHQALPFMDFSAAKWEALLAVRNFFRDTTPEQSVYDELLVVHPPTRIVGGLTLKF